MHAIAVLDDRLQQRAHRREPVDHRHLRGLGRALDLTCERARGRGVALADVGGENQHALGPGAPARCRCAVAAWHTVQALPARWTERPGRKHGEDALKRRRHAKRSGRGDRSHLGEPFLALLDCLATQLGAAGLLGIVVSIFGVVAGAAGSPTPYVPARIGGWPGWLSGPLHGLGIGIGSSSFQVLTLLMCAGYVAALLAARVLPGKAIALAILAANLLLLLGPPLISQDVFGYLEFARLGVLHGLDPYTHVAAEAPTDAVFPFIGWPFQHSPYGPLFTLGTYPLASLGLGGGLWALKLVAVASSLAAVALTASAAGMMGRSPKVAAVFVGLNPVLLELAVGGAHNDTLVLLVLAGALALAARKTGDAPRARGGHPRLDKPCGPPRDGRPARRRDRREGLRRARAPVRGACPHAMARASACGGERAWRALAARGRGGRRLRDPCLWLPGRFGRAAATDRYAQPARGDGALGRPQRTAWVVARPVRRRLPGGAGADAVAHCARRGMAGDGRLGHLGSAAVDRLATALVCDMGAAAGRAR